MTATAGSLSRSVWLALLLTVLAVPAQAKDVVRCGWYANPTPGNHWLTDRDTTWTLSLQGGPAAPGWLELPASAFDFESEDRWVRTNGYYGYGCACITGHFASVASGAVIRVRSMKPLPLSRCLADPDLPRAGG